MGGFDMPTTLHLQQIQQIWHDIEMSAFRLKIAC